MQQDRMLKDCFYCRGYNFWGVYWRHDFDCPVYRGKMPPKWNGTEHKRGHKFYEEEE